MIRRSATWRAFKAMMMVAARDPIWALLAIIAAPYRVVHHLIAFGGFYILVFLVISFGLQALMQSLGIRKGDALWVVGDSVFTVFWLVVLFRLVTAPMVARFGETSDDTHGSARFGSDKETALLTRSRDGLLLGRDAKTGKFIRYDGPAHLLTMAPTRSGKGVGTILPNLLDVDRSIICIDPKGENARIAFRARERFGPVHVLDPFDITQHQNSSFNPLDAFDPQGVDLIDDASNLSDALVFDEPGLTGEAHWNEEAKALIGGLILHIVSTEPRSTCNLSMLRHHLTLAADDFSALLKTMQESPVANGLVARAANRHLAKSDREAAGVLSAAQRHTHFLDSPRITAVLARSAFRFSQLKSRTMTVFLVLPPDRLGPYARWLRLLVTQSLSDLARTPGRPPAPVLYLLDEFAALGYLAPVERAMGLMAGYGVQLWPILQDIHQLRATYGRRAGTFLSNAGVLQVFGINDHESARLVSDLLGQETIAFRTMALALDAEKSGISYTEQRTGRALLTPDEVRNLPAEAELLFLAGRRPIIGRKLRYYADREFANSYDAA
ncbi:type IV secretory system conjugative DNA transfer family protein [Rhizobium sp. YTU87027]|uniref:type IV secretory system conjugative DNA transfer family protein n=1 Tax=Rhizobium sp. YTU87027 TaxID=3417741 RepID=UPI003D688D75